MASSFLSYLFVLTKPRRISLLVPTANIGQPTAIAYLAAQERIFWADTGVGEIWSMKR
jgi:hypothetical protein